MQQLTRHINNACVYSVDIHLVIIWFENWMGDTVHYCTVCLCMCIPVDVDSRNPCVRHIPLWQIYNARYQRIAIPYCAEDNMFIRITRVQTRA